jgi:hypothetical protein
MTDIDRFPSEIEREFSEKKAPQKEFHMPHGHGLTPFQKVITVIELAFVGWLLYLAGWAITSDIKLVLHVLN